MGKTERVVLSGLSGLLMAAGAQAADFPRWRGSDGSGSAGECDVPLIESWAEARVAWVSEIKNPHPWNFSVVRGRTQWPRTVLANGGHGMGAVWDGKVYVSFWRGTGDVLATSTGGGGNDRRCVQSGIPEVSKIDADEVIVCMDAKTGRTLWEAVFPNKGINWVEAYGTHNNPCVASGPSSTSAEMATADKSSGSATRQGRVYAIGGCGWMLCADAVTGKPLWSAPTGPRTAQWEAFKAECIKRKFKPGYDSPDTNALPAVAEAPHPLGGSLAGGTYNICPQVAEGVVIGGDYAGAGVLIGWDGETGKELWRVKGAVSSVTTPLVWKHKEREYVIVVTSGLACYDPRTGKRLWVSDGFGSSGYDNAPPAIYGDYVVAHGGYGSKEQKPLPPEKQEGWVCYRMSPEKAEKVWAIDGNHRGAGYVPPVIHNGIAWMPFRRPDAKGGGECDLGDGKSMFVYADLKTGKVLGEVAGGEINFSGPVAMGDRMFYQSSLNVWMTDINRRNPKYLGEQAQPVNWCSSATAADGFVYFRSAERMIVCLDVRAPRKRPKVKAVYNDPANARFDLALSGAQRDGSEARFHFRGRKGTFEQSWATVPPHFNSPDVLDATALKVTGGRVEGKVSAMLGGTPYEYALNMTLKDGAVTGSYNDLYRGQSVTGRVDGTMLAWADRNCLITTGWPRHWINGQNQGHEHRMKVKVVDGKVTEVTFEPRLGGSKGFAATAERFDLTYDGKRLSGTVMADVKTDHIGRTGKYKIDVDLSMVNNLMDGKVKSLFQGEGAKQTEHTAWASITVPETEAVKSDRAVFTVRLVKSVLGKTDMTVHFTSDGGKVCSAQSTAHGTAGFQKTDFSGLTVDGNRVKGEVKVLVDADGYYLRADSVNVYRLDLTVDRSTVTGTYEGVYDLREPRQGTIAGTYLNEG